MHVCLCFRSIGGGRLKPCSSLQCYEVLAAILGNEREEGVGIHDLQL